MPSAGNPADLLVDLSAALASLGVRWYVFGAQAALIWGRPRLTTDVDATVALAGHTVAELLTVLKPRGFVPRPESTDAFITATQVLPLHHWPSELPLDLVLAGLGLEQAFLERAVLVDVAGTAVPFISAEDLIATKVLAGRAKDIEDVRGILLERGGVLDTDRIAATLRTLETGLERSDLVRVLEAELTRWREETQ